MSELTREFPVLVGLHKNDVYKILSEFHRSYRLIEEDGRRFKVNESCDKNRINLYIKDDIVVDYKFF